MRTFKVKDVMSANPIMIDPTETVEVAAVIMKRDDCGVLPVGTPAKVVGILTDRDIAIRLVAAGRDARTTLAKDIMTEQVYMCEEHDSLETAAASMRKHDVSRLMVSDGSMISGIVTLADLLRNQGDRYQSDSTLHVLLGTQKPKQAKTLEMASAGAGCEVSTEFDEAL